MKWNEMKWIKDPKIVLSSVEAVDLVESACAALLSLSMEEENIETMRQSNSMALLVTVCSFFFADLKEILQVWNKWLLFQIHAFAGSFFARLWDRWQVNFMALLLSLPIRF